ncbi:MAG: Translation initiation factor IF-2 [Candidatus Omnitrophica bacterium ADurb.Bin277]|nr:MAG: Translation initiation factor IF-2 [Candidatus Omnitrophica bacterium ADurb.Bin277]
MTEKKEKKETVKRTAKTATAKTSEKKTSPKKAAAVKPAAKKTVKKPRAKKDAVPKTAEAIPKILTQEKPEVRTTSAPDATETKVMPPAAPKVEDQPVIEKKPAVSSPAPVVEEKKTESPKPEVQPVPEKEKVRIPEPPKPEPVKPAAIEIRFPVTVGDLAQKMSKKVSEVIKTLMGLGIFANVNQLLNEEIVFALADAAGVSICKKEDETVEKVQKTDEGDDPSRLKLRPPVVTMMGHVDHGKTSLLDSIRSTNVAAREKGFITQHIGAYGVDIPGRGHVTFLDTPGHEAFTAMRARGANVTDIVILVVAGDDGVMPQTVEAIHHAREAGCPIIVAINKCDLPAANPQQVMGELQKQDLVPEEWGGKTICMKVSAKNGKGIPELLEMLLLQAEIMELKANPDCPAVCTVVESHLSRGSGPIATVIVRKGTLRAGDIVVAGSYMGRVRVMKNDRGKAVREAKPAYAVELSGLNGVPEAGETVYAVKDEKTARRITEQKILEIRERQMRGATKHMSLENLYSKISEGSFKELKLIVKADVQGSVEALTQSLEKLTTEKCQLHVIHGAVGGINESDVMLAAASDAIVIGFHVKSDPKAMNLAEKEGVDIRFYGIIYDAVEKIRKAMEGILEPDLEEVTEGKAQIRQIFKSSKVGTIGGARVIKGRLVRHRNARVVRNNVVVFDGKFSALKHFKDDVKEVAEGHECGISFVGFNDLREGDIVECYRIDKIAATL